MLKNIFFLTTVYYKAALTNNYTGDRIMNNADNSTELSADEVNNRLDELYAELKPLNLTCLFSRSKGFLLN